MTQQGQCASGDPCVQKDKAGGSGWIYPQLQSPGPGWGRVPAWVSAFLSLKLFSFVQLFFFFYKNVEEETRFVGFSSPSC